MPAGAPPPRPVGSSAACPKPHLVPFLCAHCGIRFVGFTPPSAGPPGHSGPLVVRVGLDRVLLRVLREVARSGGLVLPRRSGCETSHEGTWVDASRLFGRGLPDLRTPGWTGGAGAGPGAFRAPCRWRLTRGLRKEADLARLPVRGVRSGGGGWKRGFPSDRALSAAGFR
jgi:hypothetical protein